MHWLRSLNRLSSTIKTSPNTLLLRLQRVAIGPCVEGVWKWWTSFLMRPSRYPWRSTSTTFLFLPLMTLSRPSCSVLPASANTASTTFSISSVPRLNALSERPDASRNAVRTSNECDNFSGGLLQRVLELSLVSPTLRGAIAPTHRRKLAAKSFNGASSPSRHFRKFATRKLRLQTTPSFT
jgi:hypothetical protein